MSLITNSAHFSHLLILVDLQQARHMGMVQGQVDLHLPSFFVVFRARRCNGGSDSLRRYLALSMDIYGYLWFFSMDLPQEIWSLYKLPCLPWFLYMFTDVLLGQWDIWRVSKGRMIETDGNSWKIESDDRRLEFWGGWNTMEDHLHTKTITSK